MDSLRIGDAERESAVAALGEHYAQGRLAKEEYDERSDAAWSARTAADLAPLFADLPTPAAAAPPPSGPTASGRPSRHPGPRQVLVPVLVVLVGLTVLTHLPFVLLALLGWFLLSRRYGAARPPWAGHGHGPGHRPRTPHGW